MQGIRSEYDWCIFGGYNLSLVWKPYRLSVWEPCIIGMETIPFIGMETMHYRYGNRRKKCGFIFKNIPIRGGFRTNKGWKSPKNSRIILINHRVKCQQIRSDQE